MNITGSWSIATAATFTHNNGTVNFIGGLAQTLGGTKTAIAFYDVVINKTAGFGLSRTGSIVTMTARNITQTQGNFSFSGTTTLTLSGNYVLTAGTFTPGTTFNLAGDWTHQTGATFVVGTGTTTLNGTGAQTIQGTIGTESFYNLTINKTAGTTVTVDPSISSLTVQGFTETQGNFIAPAAMTINGNTTWTAGTFTAGSTITMKGNLSKASAAIFTPGTSTVTFDAAVAQTINGTSTSLTFYNAVVNKGASSILSTGGSVATLTFNNLQHTLGGFTSPATLNINGNYTQDGGTLTFGATTANVYGNWIRNAGTFTQGTSTVKLLGSANAQTVGGATSTTFNNFQINNTYSTAPQVSVTASLSTTGTLTLTSGIVNMNSNTITLGTSAASNGTLVGGSSTAYLSKGTFNRWYATTVVAAGNIRGLFPVGDHTGNGYSPYYITAPATAPTVGGTISVSYSDPATNQWVAILDGGSTVEVRTDAGWTSTVANGLSGGTFNLSASRAFGVNLVGALANLRLVLASTVVGTSGTNSGTLTNPVITRTGLTSTELSNVFYIGSTSYYSSPLPIELGDFKAIVKNNKVDLDWFTFSESENDYFTIERSKDGISYEKVIDIDGAGNSSSLKNYATTDLHPYSGVSFYRLSQTDFDGDTQKLKVVTVRINNPKSAITSVYPNPNNGTIINTDYFSDITENVTVELVDLLGRTIYSETKEVIGGEVNSIVIQPDLKVMDGKYLVVVTGEAGKFCSQIIVK
jgi:hypothetical protein